MKKSVIIALMSFFFTANAYAGEITLERYSIGSSRIGYYVEGTVKNNTGKTCDTVCINFSLYSTFSKDKFLGSVGACEHGLRDGATWLFKTYSADSNTVASVAELNHLRCTHK